MMMNQALKAQDLQSHKWEHRLLLIFTPQAEVPALKDQLAVLKTEQAGLIDRKLVVYQIFPDFYYKMNNFSVENKGPSTIYKSYMKAEPPFKVVLIGLDGAVKLEQTSPLTTDQLFAKIDAMPMRQAELREKNRR